MLDKGNNPRVGENCDWMYTLNRSWQYCRLGQDVLCEAVTYHP
jgi:hypothetical protein